MASVQALWRRRDLVGALASSEFKGRYRRTGIGALWAAVHPLIQGALIAVVFSVFVRFAFPFPYALFVLTGLGPWQFFVTAVTTGTTSLVDRGQIVQRVGLPRAVMPTATLLTALYGFAFVLGAVLVIALVLAPERLGRLWLLPVPVALQALLIYGVTLITSTLHVRYRDVGQLVQAGLVTGFWATPIVYPLSFVESHEVLAGLVRANPMTGVLSLYRAAILDVPIDGAAVAVAVAWTAVLAVVGWVAFARRESTVADFI